MPVTTAHAAITTSEKAGRVGRRAADDLARAFGLERVARDAVDPAQPTLIVTRRGLRLRREGRDAAWHPGMEHVWRVSWQDHPLVRAAGLQPGDRVLDLTLGLGHDARFVAAYTGAPVLAVERVVPLFLLASEGLAAAGDAVDCVLADAWELLPTIADDSFDVVLVDPMFPPREGASHSFDLLRGLAADDTLDAARVAEARRVARRCVVAKQHIYDDLGARLGADVVHRRQHRSAAWAVWSAERAGAGGAP